MNTIDLFKEIYLTETPYYPVNFDDGPVRSDNLFVQN